MITEAKARIACDTAARRLSEGPVVHAIQSRWYVVHSKLRQERRALEHLGRQGYSCYLPMLRVERRRLSHKLDSTEPLFPRYLFIRLDDVVTNWHPIRSTRGVDQLVCCNGRPLPLKDEIVEQI